MVINENNSQISSFVKGMNSDSAYDQIENSQYVFGQNIRITKNQLIGGASDYSSLHEGIVTPVIDGIKPSGMFGIDAEQRILNICTIDRLGVVITTDGTDMFVYRFQINEEGNEITEFIKIWSADNVWDEAPEQISAVLYKELENVIKLYIATGEHPIISFRVDNEGVGKVENANIDSLINNRILPQNRVFIEDKISGRLTTGQVQYTYRCYNKYGNATQLAPLTNKIQVIDSSRSKEIGNAEDTETSIGFTLSITFDDNLKAYDRIQVYRLNYIKPNEDAEVSLIYDDNIKLSDNKFIFNDVGIDPLQELTMEEFSAMSGLILVPQTIEQNQEYMFCGNVKDDTIIKGVYINTNNDTIQYVGTEVTLSTKIDGDIPEPGHEKYKSTDTIGGEYLVTDYLREHGINPSLADKSYEDIFTSSLLRSLRRGEEYRYAIVYYDKYGRRTDVLDLGKKNIQEYTQNIPFEIKDGKLIAKPIGAKITIPVPISTGDNSTLKVNDIIGCQIVRRSAAEVYQKALLQVALARPVRQGLLETQMQNYSSIQEGTFTHSPYYPTGLLQTNDLQITPYFYVNWFVDGYPDTRIEYLLRGYTDTKRLYQIFSSEIDFRRDDVLSRISQSGTKLNPLSVIKGVHKKYKNQSSIDIETNKDLYTSINATLVAIDKSIQEKLSTDNKSAYSWVFNFYDLKNSTNTDIEINSVKDVKIPNWEDGFSNILKDSDQRVASVIMKYKS